MIENSLDRKIKLFAPILLNWSKENFRDFPWRKEFDNPYKVLCTEVLLQKTSAEKVLSIYSEFFNLFPTELELANSKIEDVIDIVKSTGLQNKKSKILKEAAQWILLNGIEKNNINRLKEEVKGISFYVTNAILCFCYGENAPPIDVNVRKIVDLVFGVTKNEEIEEILVKCSKNLKENELKRFYLAIIDAAAAYRSSKKNPLDEVLVLVTIDENSYNKLKNQKIYWRFAHASFKKDINYIAFYRKTPVKAITMIGKIDEIKKGKMVNYMLSQIFEIDPPIVLNKGDYPPVSYKYSTLF